jgi:hypothetical protein
MLNRVNVFQRIVEWGACSALRLCWYARQKRDFTEGLNRDADLTFSFPELRLWGYLELV